MKNYIIRADGCDDSTAVALDLTAAEFRTVQRVAEAVTAAARYGCMPRISVVASTPEALDELREAAESYVSGDAS